MVTPQQLKDFLFPTDVDLGKQNRKNFIEKSKNKFIEKGLKVDLLDDYNRLSDAFKNRDSLFILYLEGHKRSEIYISGFINFLTKHDSSKKNQALPTDSVLAELMEFFVKLGIKLDEIINLKTQLTAVNAECEFSQVANK